jgi:hypothetical protein
VHQSDPPRAEARKKGVRLDAGNERGIEKIQMAQDEVQFSARLISPVCHPQERFVWLRLLRFVNDRCQIDLFSCQARKNVVAKRLVFASPAGICSKCRPFAPLQIAQTDIK